MSNLREKAIEFAKQTSSESAFMVGYDRACKEYKEKLRWIPVEEKLPEPNSEVLAKDINGDIEKVLFHTMQFSIMHNLGFITHWRCFL